MSGLYLWGMRFWQLMHPLAPYIFVAAAVIEGTAHGQLQRAQNAVRD